jgi:hypothetical protein
LRRASQLSYFWWIFLGEADGFQGIGIKIGVPKSTKIGTPIFVTLQPPDARVGFILVAVAQRHIVTTQL